ARVAPLKKLTLPRLELMGTLIGARLAYHLRNVITDASFYFWIDSMIALSWIRGSAKKWKPFVANRVTEIQELSNPSNWSYCEGLYNPADKLTRGMTMTQLLDEEIWWKGPNWLFLREELWPKPKYDEVCLENEKRSTFVSKISVEKTNMEPLFPVNKYSKLQFHLRVTARILQWFDNFKKGEQMFNSLSVEIIKAAEAYWIKFVQYEAFQEEIESIKSGSGIKIKSKLAQLCPFLDENGLLRVGGRLQFANLNRDQKHPIILPKEGSFTEMIIRSCHERVMHSGLRDTIIQIRERYWIIKGRQKVKSILRKCVVCRRLHSLNFNSRWAPLPSDRTSLRKPFEAVGVDFAGPLYIKGNDKTYIALFTCSVTRAVHLELVSSMNSEAFMLCLKRFISRRGIPNCIYSDNGKTFKRVNSELQILKKCVKEEKFQNFLRERELKWKFIAERAPWWGGFWERLVRSAVLNSRPLTYVYNESHEEEALTPAHFLIGTRILSLPTPDVNKNVTDITRSDICRKWKYRQKLIDNFWKRWSKEYLLELRTAHFNSIPMKSAKFNVNDVVLVKEDNIPRQMWKL
ncbi:uncharacterized protein B4U79_12713, partial [Dinothrombium tinctorium]